MRNPYRMTEKDYSEAYAALLEEEMKAFNDFEAAERLQQEADNLSAAAKKLRESAMNRAEDIAKRQRELKDAKEQTEADAQ